MLFNSINFLVFFPVVTTLYFLLPHRMRWVLLLVASCFFYMSFIPVFILILAFTITVDYFAGIAIENAQGVRRKQFLVASIVANIGVLFVFKYFNFFNQNIANLAQFLDWNYSLQSLALILPIGLSFHTFQSLSYTIEVFRGKQKAERHFGILATYVMFYPQLVAGPIERPQNLLHQFFEEHKWEWGRVGSGIELMLFGFFKKLVIADNLAPFVNQVYEHPHEYIAPSLLIATVFFAFQIYCDFSGYSDIAIGAARVMGIRLMTNFHMPYFSRSIGEFWRRWHISLSTWFRDYLYIPMGGSHGTASRTAVNLLVTFALSGFWHGANWTYVIWGGLNGLYLVCSMATAKLRSSAIPTTTWSILQHLRAWWQTLLTFGLILVTWIFFRATSVTTAWFIITEIFTGWGVALDSLILQEFVERYIYIGRSADDFFVATFGIFTLLVAEYLILCGVVDRIINSKWQLVHWILRWFVLATAGLCIIALSRAESQQFIYFQF